MKSDSTSNHRLALLMSCLLLGLFKIWLVRDFEIAARFMPADQSWYLNAAQFILRGQWLGPYDSIALLRQPGYPLWLALSSLSGIPLRLSSEWLLIASAILFALTLLRIGFSFWPALLAYFLVVFHPEGFHLYNEVLSDTFYGPVLLASLCFLTLAFVNRENRRLFFHAAAAGLCLGWLWNTRHENLLLLVPLGLFGFFLIRHVARPRSRAWRRSLVGFAIPLALIVAFASGVRWMNWRHYGVSVVSEMLAPGFIAANSSLARIKRQNLDPRVPVPREIREQAYSVSPAFRELQPYLEGPAGKGWIHWGCMAMGACEDIAGGWFMMALREAVAGAGHYSSAPAAENFYRQIEREIAAACSQGSLKCYPPLTSRLGTYANIHNFPSIKTLSLAALRIFGLFGESRSIFNSLDNPALLQVPLRESYDLVARRRITLARMENFSIQGRVVSVSDPIVALEIRDGNGVLVAESKVSGGRFSLSPQLPFYDFWEPSLVFVSERGTRVDVSPYEGSGSAGSIRYQIEKLGGFRTPPPLRKAILRAWPKAHDLLIKVLLGINVLLSVACVALRKRFVLSSEKTLFYLMAVSTLLLRVAALALLDSTSFPVAQYYRLLYPVKIIYDPLLLLWGFEAWRALTKGGRLAAEGADLFRRNGASTSA